MAMGRLKAVAATVGTLFAIETVKPGWIEEKAQDVSKWTWKKLFAWAWALFKPFVVPVFIVILFAVAAWRMLPTTDTTNKVATNKTGIVKVTTWVSFVGVVLGVMLRLSEVTEFAKTMTLPDIPEFPSITVNPLYVWYVGYIAVALCVAYLILKCCADCKDARYEEHRDAVRYNKKEFRKRWHRKKYAERYN
jgi:hypothetical protein